jgi:hypothetical protein
MINQTVIDSKQRIGGSGSNKTEIKMPITRESMMLLCNAMNIKITPTKCIDAILYCRGPLLEKAPPEDFEMK